MNINELTISELTEKTKHLKSQLETLVDVFCKENNCIIKVIGIAPLTQRRYLDGSKSYSREATRVKFVNLTHKLEV